MSRNSDVDQAVADLQKGEAVWASLTLGDRRALLGELVAATEAQAKRWVDIALEIKGLAPDSPLAGEEWISGPYPVLTGAGALMASLEALERGGSPVDGFKVTEAPGGRRAVHVLPHNAFDWLLLNGFEVEVWTQPGAHPVDVHRSAGLAQKTPELTGGVGLVLGAGNIFSIAPLDTLYELFAHNRVVVLKLNPITDRLLPVLEEVFAPFIARDLVRIVRGGADVGTELAQHPAVTHVHMTGSNITHDAIVFGPGEAGAARKAANNPLLTKPMTSELGGVSPTIVLPGKWSARDLRFQAEHLVTQKLHNNGYNCVASQVVVLSADWPQKQQFLNELRWAYDAAPTRTAYYPGSDVRVASALESYPEDNRIGQGVGRHLVTGLSPDRDEDAFRTEYFSPVLGVTELPGTGLDFLGAAVDLANNRLTGTLGVNLIAHPKTLRTLGQRFENAIANLRYGTVAVNAWTGVGFLTARASWGAFPGHTVDDVQSGIGVAHNALLIKDPERTVVRGPFRPSPRSLATGMLTMSPRPPWFVTNRTAAVTGRRLTYFAARPRWRSLPAIFASALRG
ncbi:aldehyde dehydrogenase family protein [Nocardioides limicola]|uniref:aldehyde dehydrogenase family protein n=1 Tax=Nocardioides limicola TaxID=2803368 RepID=UPI00193BE857|nr:aldehyde dehydrogenase family protein [Nocardioides sp. DJM-14]